jgi:hypothetical protein
MPVLSVVNSHSGPLAARPQEAGGAKKMRASPDGEARVTNLWLRAAIA